MLAEEFRERRRDRHWTRAEGDRDRAGGVVDVDRAGQRRLFFHSAHKPGPPSHGWEHRLESEKTPERRRERGLERVARNSAGEGLNDSSDEIRRVLLYIM